MNIQAKHSSPPSSSLSSLSDEIVVNCLARISRSYYPTLSLVSKSFRSILSSTELYEARSHLGSTEKCLYVCTLDHACRSTQWFRLCINPNRTRPDAKKTIGHLFVPIPSPYPPSLSNPTIAAHVGSEIYVIGGTVSDGGRWSSAVRVLDCRSHAWRDAPSMIVARMHPRICVYDGKIYVMGGCQGLVNESWAEVFDTKTQNWACLPDPGSEVRECSIDRRTTEIDGIFYFGNRDNTYAYDTKQGKWLCGKGLIATFPMSECVLEDVSYTSCFAGQGCWWFDIKSGVWREVKGLESLLDKFKRNGGKDGHIADVVSFGGKLLLLWEDCTTFNADYWKTILCAEIGLEKRDDGDEVWGNVEWVDVVHSAPKRSCQLLRCLVLSV